MIRTYVDAGVLIAAVRGERDLARSVYDLLENPEREFVASVFVRLDVLPKAIYQRRLAEIDFYQWYFARVVAWADPNDAAAQTLGADELVTTEGNRKPIHRAADVRVVAI